MVEENELDLRKAILELVRTKDEINKEILESVNDLKRLLIIEEGTGRIIILNKQRFKNTTKIELEMMGKYIAFRGEIIGSPEIDIQTISEELGILKTTLSAPLGDLVKKNILLKRENFYRFNESFLKEETQKIMKEINDE